LGVPSKKNTTGSRKKVGQMEKDGRKAAGGCACPQGRAKFGKEGK